MLQLVNTPAAPIGDATLVAAALDHANGVDVVLNGVAARDREASRSRTVALLERVREAHRGDCGRERRGDLIREIFEQAMKLLGPLKVRQVYEIGARGLSLEYFRDFPSVESALGYGVLLLLDPRRPFGAAVCRCRLGRCTKFYQAARRPSGGPANRTYCTPEHRAESHDSTQSRAARRQKRVPRKRS